MALGSGLKLHPALGNGLKLHPVPLSHTEGYLCSWIMLPSRAWLFLFLLIGWDYLCLEDFSLTNW